MEAAQDAMARQAGSPENTEAITAFMGKRPPNFRDLQDWPDITIRWPEMTGTIDRSLLRTKPAAVILS